MSIALTRRQSLAMSLAAVGLMPGAVFAQAPAEIVEMSLGSEDAPITVVEYASFTCPHCASFHSNVLPQLKENFVDTGKVHLVYREVYFDRAGLWAAMIARCAGADRYFGVADLLYQNQSDWSKGPAPEDVVEKLFAIGRQAGMTDDQMNACMSDREFAEGLVEEYQKNVAADGIDSTPSFVINGEKSTNMSYADFEAKLNGLLPN